MSSLDSQSLFTRARSWLSRRGLWGALVAVALTVFVIASGVGMTMAATGVLPAMFALDEEPTAVSSPASSPGYFPTPISSNSSSQLEDGFDTYEGIDWESVSASGFTGLQISFSPGRVSYIAQAIKDGEGSLTIEVFLNGNWWANSSVPCSHTRVGQTCGLAGGDLLDAEHGYCAPGGDVLQIRAHGFGIDETKTVAIPRDVQNCPALPEPEPEPEPTAESVPENDATEPEPAQTASP
jgi:hypothetical protein